MNYNLRIWSTIKIYRVYLIGFFVILILPVINAFPFFNLPNWFSPPDFAKTLIFRCVLSVILLIFIYQILFKGGREAISKISKTSFYFKLLSGIFLVFLLLVIFSQDPYYSLFGDPNRSGGFLNFGFYIIFSVLAFLIIHKNDWKKIWNFSIFIGILISILAIFQAYGVLSNVFKPENRPSSTIGNAVLLAIYLLILVFISLIYLLKEKGAAKKIFYLFSLLLFLFVILLTGSRGAFFGLLIGFFYFLFSYPKNLLSLKWHKALYILRIIAVLLLLAAAFGVYYINTTTQLPNFLKDNKIAQGIIPRLSISLATEDPRFSAWLISLGAIKEKPILGWGPENFSIAFDKYYDPSFSQINKDWGSWYDRAHNFLFDIAVTSGLPALILYISFFAALFWGLQKVKEKKPENSLICHGIQATFFAYFSAELFGFDTFSSYIILFLLVAFSLKLILDNKQTENKESLADPGKEKSVFGFLKTLIMVFLSIGLILFIWVFNIKPLKINAEINSAPGLGGCQKVLAKMDKIMENHSFLDHYLGIKYANIVNSCLEITPPESSSMMVKKAITILENNTKLRPNYTRDWLYLGIYTNFLLETSADIRLKDKAEYYFKKAQELSPKKQEIFTEWAKTYYVIKDYTKAKEIAQQCIDLSPTMAECWWTKGVSNIYLGNLKEAKKDIEKAKENQYDAYSPSSLSQLMQIYLEKKNYEEMVWVHQKLMEADPKNIQYRSALAYNYKIIGDYKSARETAQTIILLAENSPDAVEIKRQVEEFLKTLPVK
jgi:putative inorganic carbon (HCO3(-)) transporter